MDQDAAIHDAHQPGTGASSSEKKGAGTLPLTLTEYSLSRAGSRSHALSHTHTEHNTRTSHTTPCAHANPINLNRTHPTAQIVDVLVIVPFLIPSSFRGFVQLRLLRVTRVLRVRASHALELDCCMREGERDRESVTRVLRMRALHRLLPIALPNPAVDCDTSLLTYMHAWANGRRCCRRC